MEPARIELASSTCKAPILPLNYGPTVGGAKARKVQERELLGTIICPLSARQALPNTVGRQNLNINGAKDADRVGSCCSCGHASRPQ